MRLYICVWNCHVRIFHVTHEITKVFIFYIWFVPSYYCFCSSSLAAFSVVLSNTLLIWHFISSFTLFNFCLYSQFHNFSTGHLQKLSFVYVLNEVLNYYLSLLIHVIYYFNLCILDLLF